MSHTDQPDRSRMRPPPADGPDVAPQLRRQIDENLQRLYRESLDEELPQTLRALVERLRSRDDGR